VWVPVDDLVYARILAAQAKRERKRLRRIPNG
jgi:hypothetical protein